MIMFMKRTIHRENEREAYRPSIREREGNRPTIDRSPGQLWCACYENQRRCN